MFSGSDGFTLISSILIDKVNVNGGMTTITNEKGDELFSVMLERNLDIILANDETTMHKVSNISPIDSERMAYRDVLVVTLIILEGQE
ncbi:2OG-Fe dioxygenase family protein [Veronia pacifica]